MRLAATIVTVGSVLDLQINFQPFSDRLDFIVGRKNGQGHFQRTKPHVNVGTIGHIDHGKTTLTASILAVQAAKGLASIKSYADIAKGGTVRDETKTVTIAVSHVEYETPSGTTPTSTARATPTSSRT